MQRERLAQVKKQRKKIRRDRSIQKGIAKCVDSLSWAKWTPKE